MSNNARSVGQLTPREIDILRLLAEDYSNREIAEKLVISLGTVKWYNRQIYNKLVVNSRLEAVGVAKEKGLLELDPGTRRSHNLPAQVTPFVGREDELRELLTLLNMPDVRLVTVMGAGGMGKSRLALEAGQSLVHASLIDAFSDGIFLVDLAPVNRPDTIFTAVADAINFRYHSHEHSSEQQLLDYLQNKNLLLILDNFEHLLDSAAILTQILRAAAEIKLLVTSRECLNLSGETIFRLSGMHYPLKQPVQNPLQYSAVQLFMQSARRVQHDFALQTEDLPHMFRICRLVQGMPLGIILAARWIEILSLSEIDQELTQSIDFLASEQRDLPRRLRSIRAVFDYSWKRMSAAETDVFTRLCVFRGGFSREASAVVAGANVHVLIKLTNKSFIEHDVEKRRYSIHELLRQYAARQLETSGKRDSVYRQHAEFYAQLAERAEPELRLADQEKWFQVLNNEHDNLRSAMAWSFGNGHATTGLRMVVALRDFWFYEGYHVEGQQWCELALKNVPDNPVLHGRVRLTLGLMAWARQQMDACRQNWEKALSLFHEAGNRRYAAWALGLLGGSKLGVNSTGYHEDVERIETAIGTLREFDDQPGVAQMLNILGNVHRVPQRYQEAKAAYEACLEVVRQTGEKRRECIILSNLALVAYAECNHKGVGSFSKAGLRIAHKIGFKFILLSCLHTLASALAASGRAAEAVQLIGVVYTYQESQRISFAPNDQHYHDRIRDDVRQQLDEKTFQAWCNKGSQMSIDNAVAFALG